MNNRLKKRGVLALIIYFLMITAVSTPIAFYTGKARGAVDESLTGNSGGGLSQNETGAEGSALPISLAMAPDAGGPDGAGSATGANDETGSGFFGPRAPSLKPAALRDAVIRAVTGGATGAGGESLGNGEAASPISDTPFGLAMAPGGASGGITQGGAVTPGAGYPGAIIPGFLSANTETPPGTPTPPSLNGPEGETPGIEEPPVLVTPIPAALPLMMTGFAGLLALGKRSRR